MLASDDILETIGDFNSDELLSKASNVISKIVGGLGDFDFSSIDPSHYALNIKSFVETTSNQDLKKVIPQLSEVFEAGFNLNKFTSNIEQIFNSLSTSPVEFITHFSGLATMLDKLVDPLNTNQLKHSLLYKGSLNLFKQLNYEYEKAVNEKRLFETIRNIDTGFCDPSHEFPPKYNEISPLNSTLQLLKNIATNSPPWVSASGETIEHPIQSKACKIS